ncbi:MAG: Rieske 2Fe-2S domain-containing protein [Nannocystaceae bacterium]
MQFVESPTKRPPAFHEARNKRQKARAAGLDPDYWYPVERIDAVAPGQVVEVIFWRRSIALYRGADGAFRAIENRCAHRQLKLSGGLVQGCRLTCPYHGWSYDGDGRLAEIPHELFGRSMPKIKLQDFPVQTKHGLVWLFMGDPARASARSIPEIPELEGPRPWGSIPADFVWRAHHSMIIDNICDFTHAFLHRKFRPFEGADLTRLDRGEHHVHLDYDTKVGRGRITGSFVDRERVDTDSMKLGYEYPYQWSNTGDRIKHWCFLLPIDEQTTRVFFLFYFDAFKIPGTRRKLPRWAMRPLLKIAAQTYLKPLLGEDRDALEAEQDGYNRHFDAPIAEFNPAVHAFHELTIRKWEEHLARAGRSPARASDAP